MKILKNINFKNTSEKNAKHTLLKWEVALSHQVRVPLAPGLV